MEEGGCAVKTCSLGVVVGRLRQAAKPEIKGVPESKARRSKAWAQPASWAWTHRHPDRSRLPLHVHHRRHGEARRNEERSLRGRRVRTVQTEVIDTDTAPAILVPSVCRRSAAIATTWPTCAKTRGYSECILHVCKNVVRIAMHFIRDFKTTLPRYPPLTTIK